MSRKTKTGKPSIGLRKPARPSPEDIEAFINGEDADDDSNDVSNVVNLRQDDSPTEGASEEPKEAAAKSQPKQSEKKSQPSNDVGVCERVDRKRRRMTIYFDDFDLADALKVKAVVENREMSEIVEAAVKAYLK